MGSTPTTGTAIKHLSRYMYDVGAADCHVKGTNIVCRIMSLPTDKKRKLHHKKYILRVFILNILISMDHRSIILVPSCLSRQDTSNDATDDPNESTLQFDTGPGHGRHITIEFITCAVTPPKWAVLPEYGHFSENMLDVHCRLIGKTARVKMLNISLMYDDGNKQQFWVLLSSFTFPVALRYAIKHTVRYL